MIYCDDSFPYVLNKSNNCVSLSAAVDPEIINVDVVVDANHYSTDGTLELTCQIAATADKEYTLDWYSG